MRREGSEDRWGTWSERKLLYPDSEHEEMGCAKISCVVVKHISVLLAVFAGAGLGIYVVCTLSSDISDSTKVYKSNFPTEFAVLMVAIPTILVVIILMAHIGIFTATWRRGLLICYGFLLIMVIMAEVGLLVWLGYRYHTWISGETHREQLAEMPALRQLNTMFRESSDSVTPYKHEDSTYTLNTNVMFGAIGVLFALELLAFIFTLCVACVRYSNMSQEPSLQRSNSVYYEGKTLRVNNGAIYANPQFSN